MYGERRINQSHRAVTKRKKERIGDKSSRKHKQRELSGKPKAGKVISKKKGALENAIGEKIGIPSGGFFGQELG